MKPRPAPCRCEAFAFPHRRDHKCNEWIDFNNFCDESAAYADELATDNAARSRDMNEAIR